jgi:high affinity sulfate transporter 1
LVPAIGWISRYKRDWLRADLVAGLTAAAVVIPKAMAYATIAGLPLQVGLYTAFIPPLVYVLLGTSATLSVTTTTTIAILSGAALGEVATAQPDISLGAATATLSLLVGLMLLTARLLRLGFLASFISDPVLTGFKAGIGCVIVVDQLPKVLGVHIDKSGFLRDVFAIVTELPQTSMATLLVAGATLGCLVVVARLLPRAPAPVIAIGGAIAVSSLLGLEAAGVSVVGTIPGGLPSFSGPERSLLLMLWPAALGIALMSFTETIAAARAFRREGEVRVVSDQELVATGIGNVVGSFFGAMPGGGGTSQTAVNVLAGARSQVSSLVAALTALATMLFLAPIIGKMPHATLAAVVIAYSASLVDPSEMRAILKVRAVEFRWAIAAFLGVIVLGTLKGILVAVLLSMLSLMYQANNPMVYELRRRPGTNAFRPRSAEHPEDESMPGVLIVRIEGRMYFANTQNVGDKLRELVETAKPSVLILDCGAIPDFEYTALKALVEMAGGLRAQGIEFVLAELNPTSLTAVRRTSLPEILGSSGMFVTVEAALESVARRAA